MSYRILIEIGHEASIRTKRTPEGYTHDWEIFVRGFESDLQHYVEKVVFNLHETFDKPRRAIKEPPYKVKESGYAGFNLLIDLYLKNPEEPKKISFFYDLSLQPSGPAIYKVQKEKYVFHHPNEEFRQRLIKGGAVLTPASSSISNHIESSRDASDRSEDRAQLVDKPKLGGDITRKHKVRPEEPKLTSSLNSFENLFGPPITKKSKISPDPKPPVAKSAPVVAPVKDKSVEKKKHSPHKDKAERSKSKDKEHSKKSKEERKEERKDKNKDRDKGKEKSVKKEAKHESPKSTPKHESPKKSPRKLSPPPVQAPPPPPPPKKEDRHESGKERDKSSDKKSKKEKRDKGKDKDKHREHKSHSSKEEKSTEEPKEPKIKEPPPPKVKETIKENPIKVKEKVPKPIEPPPPPVPREKEPEKVEKVHKSDKHEEKHKHKHKKKDKDKTKKEEKRHEKKIDKNQIEITKVPLDESSSSSKTSVQAEVEKENQKQNNNEVLIEKTIKEKQAQPKPPDVQPIDEESNDSNVSRKSKAPIKPPEPVKEPEVEKPKKSKKHKDKHKSTDEKKRKRKSSSKVEPEPEDITIVKVPKIEEEVQSEEEQPQNGVVKAEDPEEDEVEFVGPAGIMPTPFISGDYLTRLKDLQERIMMLQDNGELQQVVQLIAETGHYEVTRHSFNFDLCTLDIATVARLQQFFTTHPGTA